MITKFKIFEEASLRDLLVLKTDKTNKDDDMRHFIASKKIVPFVADVPFLDKFEINDVTVHLNYNNTKEHDLLKRIENRTDFKSVTEFNEFYKQTLYVLLTELLPRRTYRHGNRRYSISFVERDFLFLVGMDLNKVIDSLHNKQSVIKIGLITISISTLNRAVGEFKVDDSDFLY